MLMSMRRLPGWLWLAQVWTKREAALLDSIALRQETPRQATSVCRLHRYCFLPPVVAAAGALTTTMLCGITTSRPQRTLTIWKQVVSGIIHVCMQA